MSTTSSEIITSVGHLSAALLFQTSYPTHAFRIAEQGQHKGKWQVGIRSYRSTFNNEPSLNLPAERTMSAFTMGENVFVLLDDPISPGRYDLQTLSLATKPTHLKSTYITLSPAGALEQLLSHLRARWGSVRGQTTGPQLTIEGSIFSIGTDWIVRVGNVITSTGSVKGILLEVNSHRFLCLAR